MVLSYPKMDDDDDLEALRLAALQTIRPRTTRNITSTNDKAKFFRPSSNPNLIAIVPLDSRTKLDRPPNSGESSSELQYKLAKILPQSVYSAPKAEEKNEVSSKFSRFRDTGSHSDDESWDEDETFTTKKIEEEKSEDKAPQPSSEQDDILQLEEGDEDSLEKLMDQMEEEFNRSEPKRRNSSETKSNRAKNQREKNLSKKEKPGNDEEVRKGKVVEQSTEVSAKKNGSPYTSKNPEFYPYKKKSPSRGSPTRFHSPTPSGEHTKARRSPLPSKRSPSKKSRSPARSRTPRRYSSRSISPRRRSPTPRRRSSRSPSRGWSTSPKQWYSSPKRQSLSPWGPWRSSSPTRRPGGSPRGLSRRHSTSPRRDSTTVNRRSLSPRKLSASPRRRGGSPGRPSLSPRRSGSPGRPSPSPGQKSASPRRRSFSPGRKSPSPRRRRKSPLASNSPRENISRKRGRSPRQVSPKRQSPASPRRRKVASPKPKNSPRSPLRRRSNSPRRVQRSPRRSPPRSPNRNRTSPDRIKSRKVPEAKRSPINNVEGRGKILIKRRTNFSTKVAKNGNAKHEAPKKVKEIKKKEEKKLPEQPKTESNLNPILEARRKKFESNNVVAPVSKRIRLCPMNNKSEKNEVESEAPKKSASLQKKTPLKESVANESEAKGRKVEDDPLSPDFSSNDVLFLEADYSFEDIEEQKEKEPIIERPIKVRKAEIQPAPKKLGRKIITLHEDRPIVQKRKISVNIKPTALLVLEEKSKKLSEHKLTQEKKEKNLKAAIDKSDASSEDTLGKKFQQRQLKTFKEPDIDIVDGTAKDTAETKAVDLRAELSRRRAERMKGNMNPACRLLQSAFEGLIGKKPVRVKRLAASPESEVSVIKKQNVTSGKGRRVKVVQRGGSPPDSGTQETEYSNENVRESQRNTHLNSQSGRSILHRNQV